MTIATPIVEQVPLRLDETGTLRVGDTRVLIDLVVSAHNAGETPQDIVDSFNTLHLADVHAVISYYLRHRDEVDAYIAEREARGEELRRAWEMIHGPGPTREELLARLAERRAAG